MWKENKSIIASYVLSSLHFLTQLEGVGNEMSSFFLSKWNEKFVPYIISLDTSFKKKIIKLLLYFLVCDHQNTKNNSFQLLYNIAKKDLDTRELILNVYLLFLFLIIIILKCLV
jgi:hypothetical protein